MKKATDKGGSLIRREDLRRVSCASQSTQSKLLPWRVGTDSPISGRLNAGVIFFQCPCPFIPILGIYYDFHRNFTPSSWLVLPACETNIQHFV